MSGNNLFRLSDSCFDIGTGDSEVGKPFQLAGFGMVSPRDYHHHAFRTRGADCICLKRLTEPFIGFDLCAEMAD
jgi:hypothetical protein